MNNEGENNDRGIIEKLRHDVRQLAAMEKRIRQLEKDHNELQESTHHLIKELKELHQVKEEWEWFFENSSEMLCIAGTDGYFNRVNPAFARNLGYTEEELLSRPFMDFVHPDDVAMTVEELKNLQSGKDTISFENRYRDSKGNWRWLSWHCPSLTPSYKKLYAIARDITERKQYDAEMLYRALHDPLTELYNRAAFNDRLENAILRLNRDPRSKIALYLIDLDGFKGINDKYGHPAGDALLKILAQRFSQIQRDGELVCRLGGDEFAFLIEGPETIRVEPLAERILEAAMQPFDLEKATVTIGCSIGISTSPEPAPDPDTLLSQADTAMYSVKGTGKYGYRIYNN